MTDLSIFRVYEPHEVGRDGYPLAWHGGLVPWGDGGTGEYIEDYGTDIVWRRLDHSPRGTGERARVANAAVGVKDIVRMQAGHVCIRCLHPYREGRFSWAPATERMGDGADPRAMSLDGLDGALHATVRHTRDVHWSPCGPACRHGAPVRVCNDAGEWRYSWPGQAREALAITEPEFGAGALVRDGLVVEAAWRILTVHHLNGVKHDLRWWNLVSLCQRCHLLIQKTVILERVWPWEHDEWFKPYAAGWYAYAYLGENLTRQETVLRMDELLALERLA